MQSKQIPSHPTIDLWCIQIIRLGLIKRSWTQLCPTGCTWSLDLFKTGFGVKKIHPLNQPTCKVNPAHTFLYCCMRIRDSYECGSAWDKKGISMSVSSSHPSSMHDALSISGHAMPCHESCPLLDWYFQRSFFNCSIAIGRFSNAIFNGLARRLRP